MVKIELPNHNNEIRSQIYEKCIDVSETFTKSGQCRMEFLANSHFTKYLNKKGLINRNTQKKSKNAQEIYKTG